MICEPGDASDGFRYYFEPFQIFDIFEENDGLSKYKKRNYYKESDVVINNYQDRY